MFFTPWRLACKHTPTVCAVTVLSVCSSHLWTVSEWLKRSSCRYEVRLPLLHCLIPRKTRETLHQTLDFAILWFFRHISGIANPVWPSHAVDYTEHPTSFTALDRHRLRRAQQLQELHRLSLSTIIAVIQKQLIKNVTLQQRCFLFY